jgi:hypothetical protein
MATAKAYQHFGLKKPQSAGQAGNGGLFPADAEDE